MTMLIKRDINTVFNRISFENKYLMPFFKYATAFIENPVKNRANPIKNIGSIMVGT
jgi:hypothetical protein